MNVLITGANRGLGLSFVHHYLQAGARVWASHRRDPGGLAEITAPELTRIHWDVAQPAPAQALEALPDRLDLLINNAGIYGPDKAGGQSLDGVTPEVMLEVFAVDCIGPLRVVQALKERVIAAQGIIANLSSKMGSSDDNTSGGCYAYRAAKAALCIVSKSMALDLAPAGVQVITLHPGWVQTDMTRHTGEIDTATSVAGMTQVINNIECFPPGSFVAWDGEIVPY